MRAVCRRRDGIYSFFYTDTVTLRFRGSAVLYCVINDPTGRSKDFACMFSPCRRGRRLITKIGERLDGGDCHERAAFLHIMEDVLGWVAVLAASVVMLLVKHPLTRLLDPAISIGITMWVLWNVWRNLRDTFRILLQGVPEEVDAARLTDEILALEGVEGLHDLHLWSQDGATHVMTLHIVVADGLSSDGVQHIKEAIRDIGRKHSADHVTVEFERASDSDCEYAMDDK